MPISSGALDWPVSYYSKPIDIDVTNRDDPWSRDHAYKNWTWKTKRGKKKRGKTRVSKEEAWRDRRRCCCCVWWWLASLLLVLLALTLYLVFWLHDRKHSGGVVCFENGDTQVVMINSTLTCMCKDNYLYKYDGSNDTCIPGPSPSPCEHYACT